MTTNLCFGFWFLVFRCRTSGDAGLGTRNQNLEPETLTRSSFELNEPSSDAFRRGLCPVCDAHLDEKIARVAFDRFFGNAEGDGDFLVRLAAGDELQHLALAVADVGSGDAASQALGEDLRQDRLFLVPSESRGLPILDRAHRLAAAPGAAKDDVRRLVLEDPSVRALHLALLAGSPSPEPANREKLAALLTSARRRETAGFSREDWTALLSDPESLKAL